MAYGLGYYKGKEIIPIELGLTNTGSIKTITDYTTGFLNKYMLIDYLRMNNLLNDIGDTRYPRLVYFNDYRGSRNMVGDEIFYSTNKEYLDENKLFSILNQEELLYSPEFILYLHYKTANSLGIPKRLEREIKGKEGKELLKLLSIIAQNISDQYLLDIIEDALLFMEEDARGETTAADKEIFDEKIKLIADQIPKNQKNLVNVYQNVPDLDYPHTTALSSIEELNRLVREANKVGIKEFEGETETFGRIKRAMEIFFKHSVYKKDKTGKLTNDINTRELFNLATIVFKYVNELEIQRANEKEEEDKRLEQERKEAEAAEKDDYHESDDEFLTEKDYEAIGVEYDDYNVIGIGNGRRS